MKHWISTSLLCLILANTAYAESEATKARQQIFTHIEEESETLEDMVDDEQWQEAAPFAEKIANKIAKLNALFPESSKDEGRARDGIWEEWSEFSNKLKNFENDFRAVSAAIVAGDHTKAEDKLDDATSACRSCHMSYRSLW